MPSLPTSSGAVTSWRVGARTARTSAPAPVCCCRSILSAASATMPMRLRFGPNASCLPSAKPAAFRAACRRSPTWARKLNMSSRSARTHWSPSGRRRIPASRWRCSSPAMPYPCSGTARSRVSSRRHFRNDRQPRARGSPMISRRHFLSATAGVATLASGVPSARAEGGQVVVGTWGGDYGQLLSDIIDKPIMTPKGFEILQDVGNADPRKTKLLAERQSRRGSMDVSCLSDNDAYIVSQSDVFEKVDATKVKRLDNVFTELKSDIAIPHIYSAQVILYNTNQVKTPPQSFADLWDPKWRGRIGLADILYPNNTLAAALAR